MKKALLATAILSLTNCASIYKDKLEKRIDKDYNSTEKEIIMKRGIPKIRYSDTTHRYLEYNLAKVSLFGLINCRVTYQINKLTSKIDEYTYNGNACYIFNE